MDSRLYFSIDNTKRRLIDWNMATRANQRQRKEVNSNRCPKMWLYPSSRKSIELFILVVICSSDWINFIFVRAFRNGRRTHRLRLLIYLPGTRRELEWGWRTRRTGEYLVVAQKIPNKVKGIWKLRGIPDVWEEKVARTGTHIHQKPIELQKKLIAAVSH